MENPLRPQENRNPLQLPSPTSYSSSSSSSNGVHPQPSTPKPPVTRSEINPYPTTFVQADTSSFKQVVQMLTGSADTAKHAASAAAAARAPSSGDVPPPTPPPQQQQQKNPIPPIRAGPKKPQSGFKLYERRNSLKSLKICPLIPGFVQNSPSYSPRKPEILSPSMLDFPSLVLSPVTPLIPDPFNRSPVAAPAVLGLGAAAATRKLDPDLDSEAEERAIAEKGFYLHRSPATTPREAEPPRLLPLFPVTSPKVSSGSSSS